MGAIRRSMVRRDTAKRSARVSFVSAFGQKFRDFSA
jgi:hypothetical protein